MVTISSIMISFLVILLAGLMIFGLNYVLISWIARFRNKNYDAVTWAFGIMAYVVTSHLFWIGLYLLKVPVTEAIFLLFYLLMFLALILWFYKRYQLSMLKAVLYSFLMVILLFLTEMLNSYFIAIILLLLDQGLTGVIRSLL